MHPSDPHPTDGALLNLLAQRHEPSLDAIMQRCETSNPLDTYPFKKSSQILTGLANFFLWTLDGKNGCPLKKPILWTPDGPLLLIHALISA